MKVKNDHHSKFSNLSNWKEEAWKKIRASTGLLYQLSYEATHWERGQFIEFISPVRSEMMWSIYEIIDFFYYYYFLHFILFFYFFSTISYTGLEIATDTVAFAT